ncbi:hypothetical protein ES702_03845 [subsurface metagenome]
MFLSISEETLDSLNLLREKGESDDALILRLVEHARSHMVLLGMENLDKVGI